MLDADERRSRIAMILENLKQSFAKNLEKTMRNSPIILKNKKMDDVFYEMVVKDGP